MYSPLMFLVAVFVFGMFVGWATLPYLYDEMAGRSGYVPVDTERGLVVHKGFGRGDE